MAITFDNRNIEGRTFNVAIYTGSIFRVDTEEGQIGYIVPEPGPSPAPFKYFTTTFAEAKEGYERRGDFLQEYNTLRPLVLLNMYDLNTRNNLRSLMSDAEKAHINYSFPLKGNRVSRTSEAGKTHHNYGVSDVICRLLAAHGIDGYYIARVDFHSEIMICGTSLLNSVLQFVRQHRMLSGVKRKRPENFGRNAMHRDKRSFATLSALAAANAANENEENGNGYNSPSPTFPAYSYGTPKKRTRRRKANRRASRRF